MPRVRVCVVAVPCACSVCAEFVCRACACVLWPCHVRAVVVRAVIRAVADLSAVLVQHHERPERTVRVALHPRPAAVGLPFAL